MKAKLFLLIASLLASSAALCQSPEPLIGKQAPALKVKALYNSAKAASGGTNLAKLKGKVVVLDFWAFW